jgi:hypothetical protein
MSREFTVVPIDMRPMFAILALSVSLMFAGIAIAARENPDVWWVILLALPVVALILLSVRRQRVTLDGDVLRVASGLHSTKVRVADLDLEKAQVANLADTPGLRPMWKTFGTATPGYRGGRFRLRNRRRAFVLLTTKRQVLSLPERSGRVLLLSLERPQTLLDALRDVAKRPSHR